MFKAVLWDFGGVITSSPFEAFNRYEAEHNLPADFIRSINSTNPDTNAWAQLESNQIDGDTFDRLFMEEAVQKGHKVRGADVLALLSGQIRPEMVQALHTIKKTLRIGCITNNVKSAESPGSAPKSKFSDVMELFDVVIESSKAGVRKPDPRIYRMACDAMSIQPEEAVFLDDLGINLKPARELGMTTIKVLSAEQALNDLSGHLKMDLP